MLLRKRAVFRRAVLGLVDADGNGCAMVDAGLSTICCSFGGVGFSARYRQALESDFQSIEALLSPFCSVFVAVEQDLSCFFPLLAARKLFIL